MGVDWGEMKRQLAELPLHSGRAPAWLFKRMWRMAGAITMAVVRRMTEGPTLFATAHHRVLEGDVNMERRWADDSYAYGGKDGHPFPVDRGTYDRTIAVLTEAVRKARVGENEKTEALRRLSARGL